MFSRLDPRARVRSFSLATVLWLFGLATTTLLVSGWGRAVAADQATLEAGAEAVVEADLVAGRITDWIAGGVADSTGLAAADLRRIVEVVWSRPEATAAIDTLVGQVVAAALGTTDGRVVIDVPGTVMTLVPLVSEELAAAGTPIDPPVLMDVVAGLEPIVIDTDAPDHPRSVIAEARTFLTTAAAAAVMALVVLGSLAIALADDRTVMVRNLGMRVMLGAVGFIVFQRIAVWATDPLAGSSPLFAGGNVLFRSNIQVPAAVGGVAIVVAATAWIVMRRRRTGGPPPRPDEPRRPDAPQSGPVSEPVLSR